jgi:hypothetical protein
MVVGVEVSPDLGRVIWISYRRVEINNGIECTALEYPGVDLFTNCFSFGSVELYMGLREERPNGGMVVPIIEFSLRHARSVDDARI